MAVRTMTTGQVRQASRLARPGWRDARLVVGVLLVLLSVLAGVRLVSSLDDTTPVYAATRPLLPGEPVAETDLVRVSVQLGDPLSRYLDGTVPVAPGTYVLRQVGPGELVPAGAIGSATQARDKTVTVPVDPAAASTLATGTVVDVWVSRKDPAGGSAHYLEPELLLERAVVAQVPTNGGALGMGVGRTAVQVVVPADRVAELIAGVDQDAKVTLVPSPGSPAP